MHKINISDKTTRIERSHEDIGNKNITPTEHQNTELQQHQVRESMEIYIYIHPCIQIIQRNSTTSTRTQSIPPEAGKQRYFHVSKIKIFRALVFDTLVH
jgi:hypothetical protein